MSQRVTIDSYARQSVRIEEVARHAGVSPATVSRVLNGRGKCSADTRLRVLASIKELGYVANAAARNLAQGKTGNLGFLLPNTSSEFISQLVQHVANSATHAGYDLLLAVRSEGSTRRLLGRHNTDGVLVFAHYPRENDIRELVAGGSPIVLLYRSAPEGIDAPVVTLDNAGGARMLIRHLIEVHGRQRIVYLRGAADSEDSIAREQGYRRALTAHGISIDRRLIRPGVGADEARLAILDLLREKISFDAVFAWCDNAAAGVLDALRSAGKAVPTEVSVVGFDDVPSARYYEPPLTTIHAPTDRVGACAVQLLVQLLQTGTAAPSTKLDTEIIVRRSCGCEGQAVAGRG